jgi:hypothetical protein
VLDDKILISYRRGEGREGKRRHSVPFSYTWPLDQGSSLGQSSLINIGLSYVWVFPDTSSFSGFRIVSGGIF